MIGKLTHKLRQFWQSDSGAGTVDGLFLTVSGLLISSVAIDGSQAWRTQTQLQVAADASALAAALYIPKGTNAALNMALDVADHNLPTDDGGTIMTAEDVVFGIYDPSYGFRSINDVSLINAVQVDARRLEERGTGLQSILMGIIGNEYWDVAARSVAVFGDTTATESSVACEQGLFLSHSQLSLPGSLDITNDTCLHGEVLLSTGAGSLFDGSIRLSATDATALDIGGFGPNDVTLDDISVYRTASDTVVQSVNATIEDLSSVFLNSRQLSNISVAEWNAISPFHIFEDNLSGIPVVYSSGIWAVDPATLQSNVIYVHDGDVSVFPGTQFAEVAIIASGEIRHVKAPMPIVPTDDLPAETNDLPPVSPLYLQTGGALLTNDWSGISYHKSFIMGQKLDLTGNVAAGASDACATDQYDTFFISSDAMTFGAADAAVDMDAVMAISLVTLSSEGSLTGNANYLESIGDQTHAGNVTVQGCPTPLASPFEGPLVKVNVHFVTARLVL